MPKIGYSNVISVKIADDTLTDIVKRKLVGGWVDLGAGVPGAFELTFRDEDKTVIHDTKAKIGADVVVSAIRDGKGAHPPLITAEITGLETDYDATGTFTVIRGYDRGHRMLRQRRVRAFEKETASTIARTIATENKIPVDSIDATTLPYDYITQANVSDWDFLYRLADENDRVMSLSPEGHFRFVKPEPASGAPTDSGPDDKNSRVLKAGVQIMRCRMAVTSSDQVTEAEARGWDVKNKKEVVQQSTAATNPGFAIDAKPLDAVTAFGKATRVETGVPFDNDDEVKNAAKSLAADITSSFAEVEVTARGNPDLRPGVPVTLSDVGKPFEGKYTVTMARHTFNGRNYECTLTVSGRQWRSLYGLASGGNGSATQLPGVAIAVVTDVQDELKQGRVRLRFPWLDDKYVSDWTRTTQLGGVKGTSLIAPDAGDEVLVAFDRGDLDHPYVIGGLYNGQDQPRKEADVSTPYEAGKGTKGKATLHSLGDRNGNRLVLLDEPIGGKQGVRLSTGDDKLTINLDRTGTEITVDSKGKVTIHGTDSVTVRGDKSVSIQAGTRLSLKAGAELDIEAATISARAAAALNLNAGASMTLDAGAAATMIAGGTMTLFAGGVGTITATGELTVASPMNLNLAGLAVLANGVPVI